ncbi:MAG: sialidase family protein [Chloroflexota bacterium]
MRYSSVLLRLLGLFAVLLAVSTVLRVGAQTTEEVVWQEPLNLSQSGTAVDPAFVIDPSGTIHLLWEDTIDGFMYMTGSSSAAANGRSWSEPVAAGLPFVPPPPDSPAAASDIFIGYTPTLIADNNGFIHAFWIGYEGVLLYSRAPIAEFTLLASWTPVQTVASVAGRFAVSLADDGRFHLAYLRPISEGDFPAGIYYRQSEDGGATWTDAFAVYTSDYYRALGETAVHVQLATADNGIFLVWDNPLLDQVFFSRTLDNGGSWQTPTVIDQRETEDDPNVSGPGDINVIAFDNAVHLVWRAYHQGENCAYYHQWSADRGANWEARQVAFSDSRDCPSSNSLLRTNANLLFLLTEVRSEHYLQAWDGAQWSEAALQEPLARFSDPQSLREVAVTCYQLDVVQGNQLLALTCGLNQVTDVWVVERSLGVLEDWSSRFEPTPVWSTPASLVYSQVKLLLPRLVAGGDGRLHAFWSESDQPVATQPLAQPATGNGNAIYYSRYEGERWAAPRPILTSPIGKTDQPSVAANQDGILFAVWSGGVSGEIYFSRAVAERASSITEWIEPIALSSTAVSGASNPEIAISPDGMLYVTYAVPLNEKRGIYIMSSFDNGDTWSVPTFVFDAEAAAWAGVGSPVLTLTGSKTLHVVWTQETIPGGAGVLSLVYASSTDGGQTWSEPQLMTEDPVVWYKIVSVGERVLHLAWLAKEEEQLALWDSASDDGGLSWGNPLRVTDPTAQAGPADLIVDAGQELHLLQLLSDSEAHVFLQEWLWQDNQWQEAERLPLDETAFSASEVAAVVDPSGYVGVIFASLIQDVELDQLWQNISYTQRVWATPAVTPTALPTLTPTATPLPVATATLEATPTPALTFPTSDEKTSGFSIGPFSTNDMAGSIVLSIIPAVLLVGVIFVVGLRIANKK